MKVGCGLPTKFDCTKRSRPFPVFKAFFFFEMIILCENWITVIPHISQLKRLRNRKPELPFKQTLCNLIGNSLFATVQAILEFATNFSILL